MIQKFRKKPVVIEAFRMGIDPRPDWFQEKVTINEIITHSLNDDEHSNPFEFQKTWCFIKTPEGEIKGDYGDYIIKGVDGKIYPCKPDIFEATYELV